MSLILCDIFLNDSLRNAHAWFSPELGSQIGLDKYNNNLFILSSEIIFFLFLFYKSVNLLMLEMLKGWNIWKFLVFKSKGRKNSKTYRAYQIKHFTTLSFTTNAMIGVAKRIIKIRYSKFQVCVAWLISECYTGTMI